MLDAYCGIGAIGMAAADQAGEVIGVELNREAVRDALSNARANGVKNIRFFAGDAGEFMEAMAAAGEGGRRGIQWIRPVPGARRSLWIPRRGWERGGGGIRVL